MLEFFSIRPHHHTNQFFVRPFFFKLNGFSLELINRFNSIVFVNGVRFSVIQKTGWPPTEVFREFARYNEYRLAKRAWSPRRVCHFEAAVIPYRGSCEGGGLLKRMVNAK